MLQQEDETTIRPDHWACMLDDAATRLKLQAQPSCSEFELEPDHTAYCEKWFRISTGFANEKARTKFAAMLESVPHRDMLVETYAFLREYKDIKDWQHVQQLIRFAEDHQYAFQQSGPKSKVGRSIYEWPPPASTVTHETRVWHEPARYIMDVPGKGRIDLGMTDPNNSDWTPVKHGSPDKAMQSILTRIRRRIGGPFNQVFSKLHKEALEIEFIDTDRRGNELIQPFSKVNHQGVWFKVLGNAHEIHDLIVPAPITAMIKGKWVVVLYPKLQPKHVLTDVKDPEAPGMKLTRSQVEYNTIKESSQPRDDDPQTYDPRCDDPLPDALDISYLDSTEIKWDVLNGYSSIETVRPELRYEIAMHIKELRQRIRGLTRAICRYDTREKVQDAGKKLIYLRTSLEYFQEQLEEAKDAFEAYEENTATAGSPSIETNESWLTVRGVKQDDGTWHDAARTPSPQADLWETTPKPVNEVVERPIEHITIPEAAERLADRISVVQMSVVERGKPAITALGTRKTLPKAPEPFVTARTANPRLKRTLAHLSLTGNLPSSLR